MFSINHNTTFLKVIGYLKGLLEHLNIDLSGNGLNTNDNYLGLGSVQLSISPEQFETFHEADKQLSINLSQLHTVLKTLGNVKEVVEYRIQDKTLNISTTGETQKFNTTLPVGKYNSKVSRDNQFNYEHSIELKSKDLYTIIKKLVVFSDVIQITLNDNTITFQSGDTVLTLEHPDGESVSTRAVFSFPSKELLAFTKAYTFSETVTLYLGTDMPLSLYYPFKDDSGNVQLYLSSF